MPCVSEVTPSASTVDFAKREQRACDCASCGPAHNSGASFLGFAESCGSGGWGDTENPSATKAGAGGYWRTLDEKPDSTVVRQKSPNACGNACAEMMLNSRGIYDINQSNIAAAKQEVLSTASSLVYALNKVCPQIKWETETYDVFDTDPKPYILHILNQADGGPCIVGLKSPESSYHMVILDGIDSQNRVSIRDPWEATRYFMRLEDFAGPPGAAWQGECVWGRKS